jgi:hypothetical protein
VEEAKHLISASLGYTFIPKADGLEASEAGGFFVPSIGLDYFYILSHKWEFGIMVDVELDHYLIIDKELERENAIITALVSSYKPNPNWNLIGGLGMEFERNENLVVLRLGVERPIKLGNNWILGPSFLFDFKEEYDTWSLALAIGKEF